MSQKMEGCWHDKTRRGNAMGYLTQEIFATAFRMGKKITIKQTNKQKILLIRENIWVCVETQETLNLKREKQLAETLMAKIFEKIQASIHEKILQKSNNFCYSQCYVNQT